MDEMKHNYDFSKGVRGKSFVAEDDIRKSHCDAGYSSRLQYFFFGTFLLYPILNAYYLS